jgi:outer membrane biosynthesis protein TonB
MTETKWTWNLAQIAKIAGVQLSEGWSGDDDHDDEDPDAKIAGEDKRQKAFEKKNKKELKAAATATPPKKADKPAEKKEAPKAEEKKPDAEKPAEKKEEPKADAEKKARGRAANPDSFNQHAKANAKSMTRGAFIKWAAEKHGKGKNYASSLFAKYNPKSGRELKEAKVGWILVHPHMPYFTLAENYEMKQMQWVDSSSEFNTVVHLSEAEAQKTAKYMSEWRGMAAVIEKITFED